MKHISEIIVVEGKHDSDRLRLFFDCDTIETGGVHLDRETIERIRAAQKARGVIVFTDPDTPGESIRRTVSRAVPGVRHAFIDKKKARTEKKVGVEHACREDLEEALSNCVTFDERKDTLSREDFLDLGLMGSAARREKVCMAFHIGKCNAKTCFKRLNQMGVNRKQIEEVLS